MKRRLGTGLCLCILLLLGWPQGAGASPNTEEIQYIQRLDMVGKIAGKIQKSLDEMKNPNAPVFAYAAEVLDFQIGKVRTWKVPAAEVRPVRDQLIRFMTAQRELYRASAKGEYKRIKRLVDDFKKEFVELQSAWQRLFPRYQP
jgi:hypothetical protein